MRRECQVLLLPFEICNNRIKVYIFQRTNGQWWQFISGGCEDEESLVETASRELFEETGISQEQELVELQTISSIPTFAFNDVQKKAWRKNIYVIPEHCFAVNIGGSKIRLSDEHIAYKCVYPEEANELLRYDSNKTALYELIQLYNSGNLYKRYYDHVMPTSQWQFNSDVTKVFHNMLSRSIPELDMMRNIVTMAGSKFVKPDTTILDLGCSCGDSLLPFVKLFGAANHYVGIDRSEQMLAQAKKYFEVEICEGLMEFYNIDLCKEFPDVSASLILSVLTMQFLPMVNRTSYLQKTYDALMSGGAFILVEKIIGEEEEEDKFLVDLYYQLKNIQGYSWQAIERKRISLQNNMEPATIKGNVEMLCSVGFENVTCLWRCLNFAAWIAIKNRR